MKDRFPPRTRRPVAPPGSHFAGRRLAAVASLVPLGSRVADVGTDHALLPRILLSTGRAARCIATDVNPARLAVARIRARTTDAPCALELRRGNGLQPLTPEDRIDVVTLAGLGARTIARILDDDRLPALAPRRLVLQPQTEPARIRRWLGRNGYAIVEERLVRERDRFYVALAAERSDRPPPDPPPPLTHDDLLEAGPRLVRSSDPLVCTFWRGECKRQASILKRAAAGEGRRRAEQRLALARRVLAARMPQRRGRPGYQVQPIQCLEPGRPAL